MSGPNTRSSASSLSTDRRDLPDDSSRAQKPFRLTGPTKSGGASSLPSPASSPAKPSPKTAVVSPSVPTSEPESEQVPALSAVASSVDAVPIGVISKGAGTMLPIASGTPDGGPSMLSTTTVKSGKRPALMVGPSNRVLAVLPRVPERTLVYGQDDTTLVTSFMLNDNLKGNQPLAEHIYNMALHLEGYNMVNLFTADPRFYHTGGYGDSKRVLSKDKTEPSFFTVGRVTHSALFEGMYVREIAIQPLAHTWPRQHAALTQMLQTNNIVVSSYKGGIQFSTARKPNTGRELQPKSIPMDGLTHGPLVRPWNLDVPVFRGVQPFRLPEYTKLQLEYDELSEGDFVIVVFTVAVYKSKKSFNITSLNLQLVIRVAEFGLDDTVQRSNELPHYLTDETPLGVDNMEVMEIPIEQLLFNSEVDVPGSEDAPMI